MLKRAAEAGNVGSQLALGTMYVAGVGVTADPSQGARWLRAAMEGGEKAAEVPYATLLATGSGVPKDDDAARAIFERAAERGEPAAQWSMGLFAAEGRGGSLPISAPRCAGGSSPPSRGSPSRRRGSAWRTRRARARA
jgi:TPR repeat protein